MQARGINVGGQKGQYGRGGPKGPFLRCRMNNVSMETAPIRSGGWGCINSDCGSLRYRHRAARYPPPTTSGPATHKRRVLVIGSVPGALHPGSHRHHGLVPLGQHPGCAGAAVWAR